MASQDAWARPLATQLVDLFRVSSLDYVRVSSAYDPGTGDVVLTETVYNGAGAVTKTMKSEDGGVGEPHSIEVWINAAGIDDIWPNTDDYLNYEGKKWRITAVDPIYGGDVRYACKVTARAS